MRRGKDGDALPPAPAEGVIAVVRRQGRYLVIRRSARVRLAPLAWCFVGGSIEGGETQELALVREFREEVGGSIHPKRKLWECTLHDGALRLHWWHAELVYERLHPNPAEVAELRWCSAEEIGRLPGLLPSNLTFLVEMAAWLRGDV